MGPPQKKFAKKYWQSEELLPLIVQKLDFGCLVPSTAKKLRFHMKSSSTLLMRYNCHKNVLLLINYKVQRGKNSFQTPISQSL